MSPFQPCESCLKIALTEDCDAVLKPPPYPRLRMYFLPRTFAAVTPFAEPDISSKAIDGMYFIMKWYLNEYYLKSEAKINII